MSQVTEGNRMMETHKITGLTSFQVERIGMAVEQFAAGQAFVLDRGQTFVIVGGDMVALLESVDDEIETARDKGLPTLAAHRALAKLVKQFPEAAARANLVNRKG